MSRFNTKSTTKTVNRAGGDAYKMDDKLRLVSILLTSFVQDQFYRKAEQTTSEVVDLIKNISDKEFIAKAAIFARTEYGMRTISHIVAGEIAKHVKGQEWTKRFFDRVVHRPDDMMEILSYYRSAAQNKTTPHALRKGFGQALARFNAYQLAKYQGKSKAISLVDIVNACHPPHTEAIEKLVKGTLKPADTWETKLTQAGQKAEDDDEKAELKTAAWKDLLENNKLGYLALLRNLRNIAEQAPEMIEKAAILLQDASKIKSSLVLPFRFLTAAEAIVELPVTTVRPLIRALNKAIDISLSNVPVFNGSTLVALDCSGSMEGKPLEIGSLFAAMLYKSNNADLMLFSNDAKYVNFNPDDSTLTIAEQIQKSAQMSGTSFSAIFDKAHSPYDRIIILSDMQPWMDGGYGNSTPERFRQYKYAFNDIQTKLYNFDLQGYGTFAMPEQNVYNFTGFSDKIFDVMKLLEEDRNALIHKIEAVVL